MGVKAGVKWGTGESNLKVHNVFGACLYVYIDEFLNLDIMIFFFFLLFPIVL